MPADLSRCARAARGAVSRGAPGRRSRALPLVGARRRGQRLERTNKLPNMAGAFDSHTAKWKQAARPTTTPRPTRAAAHGRGAEEGLRRRLERSRRVRAQWNNVDSTRARWRWPSGDAERGGREGERRPARERRPGRLLLDHRRDAVRREPRHQPRGRAPRPTRSSTATTTCSTARRSRTSSTSASATRRRRSVARRTRSPTPRSTSPTTRCR